MSNVMEELFEETEDDDSVIDPPCFDDNVEDDDTQSVEYFNLEQHPVAKDIYDSFDPEKEYNNATLADIEHFDGIWPSIEFYLFFKQAPSNFEHYYSIINHNIRSYTLFLLATQKKIKLYSFDSSGALSSLKISATEEVLVPSVGKFVITIPNPLYSKNSKEDPEISLILHLVKQTTSVEWATYTKEPGHYAIFDKMFRKEIKNNNFYEGKVFDNYGEFLDLPDVTFDDIYLDEHLRSEIKHNVIDYIDEDSVDLKLKNNIPTKRGVIFAGAPGTGKTYLSRVLANTLDTTFMVVTEIDNIGIINHIFNFAKKFQRIIILFEDIDIYVKNRNFGSSLLPALLNSLDGMEVNNHVVVLCTTNDVDVMDKALKDRPGRFDRALTFESPSVSLKAIMLEGFCKGKDVSNIDFKKIAEATPDSFTGAHLKELYITACNEAIFEGELDKDTNLVQLSTSRFIHALNSIKQRKETSRIGFSSRNS